jgi:serpin B
MKTIKCVFMLLIIVVSADCCWAVDKPNVRIRTDEQLIVEGNNKFALGLYAKLQARQGNLFFSPYSISTALAMTYAGARGKTAEQMTQTLQFPFDQDLVQEERGPSKPRPLMKVRYPWEASRIAAAFGALEKRLKAEPQKDAYELTVANALWGQKSYGFLKQFLELIETNYDGRLNEVDFIGASETARRNINAWVQKKTKNKIKNLIARGVLKRTTRLVLTNAIYFKGNWARQFEISRTKQAPFTLLNGDKVNVPMMNQTAQFPYMETEDFQALELPYVGNELSMIIFLPQQVDGLPDFEKTLMAENLSQWLTILRKRKVHVYIPKFKMTSQFSLASVLKTMGMTDAFEPNLADLSGMNGKKDLFISAVVHKAYVDVNEEGTEAAAATGVVVGVTSVGPRKTPIFRADHPFLFLIRDNQTGSILFIGRVMNPKT